MGMVWPLLAEGAVVFLGVHIARMTADLDIWELLTRHPFSGGSGIVGGLVLAFNAGQFWRRDRQLKADVAHIKAHMLTAETLENTLLKLEDHFDEKYVIRGEKPNGKSGERMR